MKNGSDWIGETLAGIGCVLLAATWLVGTPLLLFASAIEVAPFLGEQPTANEQATAMDMLLGGMACGFLAPPIGLVVALVMGWRAAAVGFVLALAVSVVGATVIGVVAPDLARWVLVTLH